MKLSFRKPRSPGAEGRSGSSEEGRDVFIHASRHVCVYLHGTSKQRSEHSSLFGVTKVRFPNTGKLLPVQARTGLWALVQSPDRIRTRSSKPPGSSEERTDIQLRLLAFFSFYLAFQHLPLTFAIVSFQLVLCSL